MSTDASVEAAAGAAAPVPARSKASWRTNPRTVRIVRYTVGVTLAAAIAFAYEWPLFFLTPVLAAFFLSLPLPGPTLRQTLDLFGYVLVAFALGLVFTLYLLPYPLIYILLLGLALFHIYYLVNRGGPLMLAVMCLIAVLILPILALGHDALASGFTLYFVLSSGLSVLIYLLAHRLFPDPQTQGTMPGQAGFQRGYSPAAALAASKSTAAVLPIAVLFIVMGWASQILVMVFAAIFSLSPQVSKGWAAGVKSLKSTLIGGAAAVVFYWLIVAVPEFHFFVALTFLTTLIFGAAIFSGRPIAQYLPSAFIALLILVSGSMGEGADFVGKLVTRIVLISLAVIYVVAALAVLDRFLFKKTV